ncbi:isochorismate synthase [Pontimonas sp.]|nr:isochorismate synthase [Pontimonas sp.]
MAYAVATPTLAVKTRRMSPTDNLIDWVSAEKPLVMQRLGQGLVGLGEALRWEFQGPDRFAEASAAWAALVDNAHIDNPVGIPGSGLVCFGAFTFADQSSHTSVIIVPAVVIGVMGDTSFRTDITLHDAAGQGPVARSSRPRSLTPLDWHSGLLGEADYRDAVSRTIERLQEGEADKVVLAREMVATAPGSKDWRAALEKLSNSYPDCVTFAIDGLLGSTPETLAKVHENSLSLRVLAGSIRRGENPSEDRTLAQELVTSAKDNDEHRFAVENVLASLSTLSVHVAADEQPSTIKLANVWHLGTDIEATLPDGCTSLDVVAALHPSAAVAGSPTAAALSLIAEMEPFDRGRYAGPVGWVDERGDGEWSIALRCAQWSQDGHITAYAGAGIVDESDPERELLETRLKFRPILQAFGDD